MYPEQKYELTIRSVVLRGEKANKALDAVQAPNPNQMHRVTAFMPDNQQVVVAQRPGKGGMDFNKLLGGKVYAVAADGMSPVFEKKDGKATKVQKQEDGKPLYSSSGFYLLSSKDYPALDIFEAYTLLDEKGEHVLALTETQLAARQRQVLSSELDFDLLQMALKDGLDDKLNLVSRNDEAMNRKRRRGIEAAQNEALDADEKYAGVAFKELAVSKKDGNPFVAYAFQNGDEQRYGFILRRVDIEDPDRDDGRIITKYLSPEEAVDAFSQTENGIELARLLAAETEVVFSFVQGHEMRTSVSFRRKVENVLAAPPEKTQFGDGVYIVSALAQWTKAIVGTMFSMHPTFPLADYDSHHYVVGLRQAEIGMNKKPDGSGWIPPKALSYDIPAALLAA